MTTSNTDRLSIALSGTIAGAIILLCVAMFHTVKAEKPTQRKASKSPTRIQQPPSPPQQMAAIQLPPPPALRQSTTIPALKTPVSALKPLGKSVVRKKPKSYKPLEAAKPAPRAQKFIKPITKAQPDIPKRGSVKPRQSINPVSKKVVPPSSANAPQQVVATVQHKQTGRVLLRMLEHGKGPAIEIAWPQSAPQRRKLYLALTQCYGMQAAVLHHSKALFSASDPPGVSWKLNIDRFSGFLRSPQGADIAPESSKFQQIARRHNLTSWTPVRVFPRTVDAVLLGGLEQLVGRNYGTAKRIQARYRLSSAGLKLLDVHVDGKSISGSVALPFSTRRSCRV